MLLFLLCKALLDHWELVLYKYCILLLLLLLLLLSLLFYRYIKFEKVLSFLQRRTKFLQLIRPQVDPRNSDFTAMPQSCFEKAVLVNVKLSGSPKNWKLHIAMYTALTMPKIISSKSWPLKS